MSGGKPMSGGHDELSVLLGGYVLGGLDDADHAAFARHLRDCRECQRQAAQLSGIPRLLDLADPDAPSEDIADSSGGGELTVLRRHRGERRRRRLTAAVAAGVAALALAGGGVLVGRATARPAQPPQTALVATPLDGSSAQVRLALTAKAWGTQLELVGTALPTSGSMALWVVDDLGRAAQVATWSATPGGQATLTAACATATHRIAAVQVRTGEGTVLAATGV